MAEAIIGVNSDHGAGITPATVCRVQNLDSSVMKLIAKSTVKFQNVTANTAGGHDLDVIGTNPLAGKRYTFNDARAKLIDEIKDLKPTGEYDEFGSIIHGNYGIGALPQLGLDDPLAHPVKARSIFTNCVESANISMKAGGMSYHKGAFTLTCTLRKFVEEITTAGYSRGRFGKATWWCFERSYKQNGVGDYADSLAIGYNRELSMYAHVKLRKDKSMLKHYKNQDIGPI